MIIFKHVLACCGKVWGCWVETEDEAEVTVVTFFFVLYFLVVLLGGRRFRKINASSRRCPRHGPGFFRFQTEYL